MTRAHLAVAWVALRATALGAQAATTHSGPQLAPATRASVRAIVDSARKAGLPATALENKALEVSAKRADDAKIIAAVRALAAELGRSRDALRPYARGEDIGAGATALHIGVSVADLKTLRQTTGRRPLATPLMVRTDFISPGGPVEPASSVGLLLAEAGLGDSG